MEETAILSIFSDETQQFREPSEPDVFDTVKIRIRVERNTVIKARLIIFEPKKASAMKRISTDKYFEFFETSIKCEDKKISYLFLLKMADGTNVVYQKNGVYILNKNEDQSMQYAFSFVPGFHVPKWAKGAVQYQIMTDRFRNSDKSNDVADREYYYIDGHSKHMKWDTAVYGSDFRHFYGGDLQGIIEKLDYLKELGIEAIYLNPIFVSPSSHKYDTQDYEHIDPHLAVIEEDNDYAMFDWEHNNGYAQRYIKRVISKVNLEKSDKLFERLCSEIHRRGMKIILDGVFNHCGSFNKWMDREGVYDEKEGFEKGAFRDVESPYRSYFKFTEKEGDFCTDYDGWWGHETLPKLNYEESEELREKIFSIAQKWASPPYSIDGWRLDVAADLGYSHEFNHKFWREFRKRVKEVNPDLVIIAEHYGDASDWLQGDQWDTVMNYDAFMEPVTFFLTGMEKHSDYYNHDLYQNGEAFFRTMREKSSAMMHPTLMCAMNELSNHDHSRFLTRTNRRAGRVNTVGSEAAGQCLCKAVFREAVTIQMTWPGSPTVYYADEAGQVGWTDPDCRRTYPWGKEDKELISLHKDLINIRKEYAVFKEGSLIEIAADYGMIAYARFDKNTCAVIAINNTEDTRQEEFDVACAGASDGDIFVQIFATTEKGHSKKRHIYPAVHSRKLSVLLQPRSSVIIIKQ